MTDLRAHAAGRVRRGRAVLREGLATTRSVLAPVARRAPEIVLSTALILTVLGALVLIGAARNDAAISANRQVAVGEVLDGSSDQRAFVRFTATDGSVLTPENGVFYPRGLEPGQLVRVEYHADEPELVRVEGRDWTEGLVPILLGVGAVWLLLGVTALGLARRRARRGDGAPDVERAAPSAPSGTLPEDGRTDDGRTDDGRTDDGRTDDGRTDDGRTDDGGAPHDGPTGPRRPVGAGPR